MQGGEQDDGRPVLVVVHHGAVQRLDEAAFELEAARRGDVLQVHGAEARPQPDEGLDDLVHVGGVEHQRDRVQAAELLEQRGLALHDRQRRPRPDVAEPQHRGPVADDRHQPVRPRVPAHEGRIRGDRAAHLRDARGVGDRQVAGVGQRRRQRRPELAALVGGQDLGVAGLGRRGGHAVSSQGSTAGAPAAVAPAWRRPAGPRPPRRSAGRSAVLPRWVKNAPVLGHAGRCGRGYGGRTAPGPRAHRGSKHRAAHASPGAAGGDREGETTCRTRTRRTRWPTTCGRCSPVRTPTGTRRWRPCASCSTSAGSNPTASRRGWGASPPSAPWPRTSRSPASGPAPPPSAAATCSDAPTPSWPARRSCAGRRLHARRPVGRRTAWPRWSGRWRSCGPRWRTGPASSTPSASSCSSWAATRRSPGTC